jgi:hypothetical protein
MELDLKGRININTKLPLSNGLHPLFEAISNSIHALEEIKEKKGFIEVEVVRQAPASDLFGEEPAANQPILGFVVHDNGIGFTDANFKSFQTSDTTKKRAKGGKGVGRFIWLKAFDRIEVESVFERGGKFFRRTFEFQLSDSGVEKEQVTEVAETSRKTIVRLIGLKAEYRQHQSCPKSAATIARRIVEHFLESFILDTCPKIRLRDDHEQSDIDLNQFFKTEMRLDVQSKDFQVKRQKFHVTHVRLLAPQDMQHSLSFCAHKRSVKTELLTKHLPNLETALAEPEGERRFIYSGYVSGQPLDISVNSERTRFDLLDQTADTVFASELCWQDILDAAVAKAKEFLEPYTRPLNEAKKERIKKFVATEAPQYRPLLKHKTERIDALRSNLTDQQLDVELYQIGQEWDLELRAEYRKLLEEKDETATSQEAFRQRYESFLDDWNDAGISKLARYVVHRKATLDLLEERRGRKDDDKYHLEDAIHEIVFPLKKTTEDVRIENMNLWIIDEKLAYHFFLASDKPLNQIAEAIEVDSEERPDLLIFNRPFAFADAGPPFSAIVIIEFKRPARNDYSEKEEKNPILQVYDYIGLLKSGKAKDRRGVPISVPDHMPIYAYIVCDLTPTLQKQAKDYQLTKTPDSLGYFGYHKEYGAYVEVISFDKLIDDAKRRNRILFEKLGLHGEATPSMQ